MIPSSLPDDRLAMRLQRITGALKNNAGASFPTVFKTEAELEGFYRFVNNERVSTQMLLRDGASDALRKVAQVKTVLVLHDTTDFTFTTRREGMGPIARHGNGFSAHFSLLTTADAKHEPLAVVGMKTFVHEDEPKRKKSKHSEQRPAEQRESAVWFEGVEGAQAFLGLPQKACIHVMDRGSDSFQLFHYLVRAGFRFVSRVRSDRLIEDEDARKLFEGLESLKGKFKRKVHLSARTAPKSRPHRAREEREALLEFAAGSFTIRRPGQPQRTHEELPESLTLNYVHVREVKPPKGAEPIDWKLVTTEPIATQADIEKVVDAYIGRWRIEEFFKALKSGCAAEKRQLESVEALKRAIAILAPRAVALLRLRQRARPGENIPATEELSELQLKILQHRVKLKSTATLYEALLAIARLGGHLKRNGDPGWITLWRGYLELLALERGLEMARLMLKM